MVITKPSARRGMRQRLGHISDSVLSIFEGDAEKGKPTSAASIASMRISRVIVFMLLASAALLLLNAVVSFFKPIFTPTPPPSKHNGSLTPQGSGHPSLSVNDYPAILVSESDDFELTNPESNHEKDSQSSLVSPKSDDEVSRASGFDSDEEPVARLIVLTMDRDKSLKRLLDSLERANYGEDHVDLDIWIDIAEDKPIEEAVVQVAQNLDWKQGTKVVHKRKTNAGLYQQWIYTWNITEETTEFAVILEDDLEVSPAFYQWLRVARAAYAQDADVGAFTLQRPTLRPRQIKGVASGPLKISSEHPVFKYKLLGTWGFAPERDQWVEFRKWFEEKRAKREKPYVNGLMTTDWYKRQEVNGFAPKMWSQWWIKFVEEKSYLTVTANLPDGTTLASNWRESGLHYSKKKPSADFPVFHGNHEQFVVPDDPIVVDWDGRIIPPAKAS